MRIDALYEWVYEWVNGKLYCKVLWVVIRTRKALYIKNHLPFKLNKWIEKPCKIINRGLIIYLFTMWDFFLRCRFSASMHLKASFFTSLCNLFSRSLYKFSYITDPAVFLFIFIALCSASFLTFNHIPLLSYPLKSWRSMLSPRILSNSLNAGVSSLFPNNSSSDVWEKGHRKGERTENRGND